MYIYLGDFYKEGYIDKDDYKKFEGLKIKIIHMELIAGNVKSAYQS